jgi:type II secretory pathway pseudopilin PulG
MKRSLHSKSREGMTLVEVVVVTILTSLVLLGVITGVVRGNQLNYANGQRMAAFGLCKELYEQMRAAEYTNVTTEVFAPTTVRLTHMGGQYRIPLYAQRSCTITNLVDPVRKVVQIQVEWIYKEKELQESLNGVIYQKR